MRISSVSHMQFLFFCFVYLSLKLSAKQLRPNRPKCYKTIGFGHIFLIRSLQENKMFTLQN